MNLENSQKLTNDFPQLYRGVNDSIEESLMPFGFECGDGWFDLIYKLSKKIHEIANEKGLVGENYPKVFQVKSKCGGLRYYIDPVPDEMFDIIEDAEHKSTMICESCGKPGEQITHHGWVYTTCDKCLNN